jgi:hypothetical protein
MRPKKFNPREQYRQREHQRVQDSASLADTFRDLKFLAAELEHIDAEPLAKTREIKYTFNLAHSKSLFRFECSNPECVGGDFDLSAELAHAVAAHDATASGEVICQGWRNKDTINRTHCLNVLRYRLRLRY